jgi:hypothetical protein
MNMKATLTLKDIVSDVLRRVLRHKPSRLERNSFHTKSHDLGDFLVDIDNVTEAIANGEGENFK